MNRVFLLLPFFLNINNLFSVNIRGLVLTIKNFPTEKDGQIKDKELNFCYITNFDDYESKLQNEKVSNPIQKILKVGSSEVFYININGSSGTFFTSDKLKNIIMFNSSKFYSLMNIINLNDVLAEFYEYDIEITTIKVEKNGVKKPITYEGDNLHKIVLSDNDIIKVFSIFKRKEQPNKHVQGSKKNSSCCCRKCFKNPGK